MVTCILKTFIHTLMEQSFQYNNYNFEVHLKIKYAVKLHKSVIIPKNL